VVTGGCRNSSVLTERERRWSAIVQIRIGVLAYFAQSLSAKNALPYVHTKVK